MSPSFFFSGRPLRRSYAAPGILVLLLATSLFNSQSALSQTPDKTLNPEAELIHFGDLIDVDVVGSLEFDWRGYLNPEGFLDSFDKSEEPIFGLCRSGPEVAEAVTNSYSKFLRDPQVVVKILDRSNRPLAYLEGAVRTPSRFRIKRPVTLRELIVQSGGFTDNASGVISVFRPADLDCAKSRTGEKAEQVPPMQITVADLLRGSADADPEIRPGDIVTVVEAFPVYVVGGVNEPKEVSSREQSTLSRAVAAAGGVSKQGIASRVIIYRRDAGETKIMEFDLKKITGKVAEDPKLKSYDIVEVAEKGRERRKYPPRLEDARSAARGRDRMVLKIIE